MTPAELRARFEAGDYVGKAARGELIVAVLDERHPSPRRSGQPKGTRSQLLGYYDRQTGVLLATAHQYRRRDGTLGASGRPDPKRVREGDVIYMVWPD